jgi:hypothetical protein
VEWGANNQPTPNDPKINQQLAAINQKSTRNQPEINRKSTRNYSPSTRNQPEISRKLAAINRKLLMRKALQSEKERRLEGLSNKAWAWAWASGRVVLPY